MHVSSVRIRYSQKGKSDWLYTFCRMNLTIGQRIVIKQNDKSHLATLAWEGELPGKKGSWYGIVYDEPQATGLSNFG